MKTTLFVLCLFFSTAAFAQYAGISTITTEPYIPQSPNHPAHASYTPLSQGESVIGHSSYTFAQGDRAASDFPHAEDVSLGAAARELRKQHAQLKKSRVVWIN
jgi:hypothetical protein